MEYSITTLFLLAVSLIPVWCESRDETLYDTDGAGLTNQISPDHQSYEAYTSPRPISDRKSFYPQSDLQHYGIAQDDNQLGNYHQQRAQSPRHSNKEHESAIPLRSKQADDEQEEEKTERNVVYQQMKQGGNSYATFYNRPNMPMNGIQPHNFRPVPQFVPKYTMEQQIQLQLQRQQMHQRMMAAQAQSFINQQHQQQYAQPPHQNFVQSPPQQYIQHYHHPATAPIPSPAPPQAENYSGNRPNPAVMKVHYSGPPVTPKPRYAPPTTTLQPWGPQGYYEEYENSRQKE